jgi:acyl-CoA carboxylase epsilon subunit
MTGDGPASGGNGPASGDASADGPVLKIVAGDPSAEELAALTVALSAVLARGGPAARPGRAASGWADRSRTMGAPPSPGPDAWRRSAWPR